MKKFLLVAAMGVMSLAANAQFYVAGSFNLGVKSVKLGSADAVSTTTFGLSPEVGYNFTKNFAFGAELGFNTSKTESSDAVNTWSICPYLRYTFGELGGGVNVFGEAYFGYDSYTGGADYDGIRFGVRPGVSVALGDNWALVGKMVLFEYSKYDELKTTKFQIAPSEVSLGVCYTF